MEKVEAVAIAALVLMAIVAGLIPTMHATTPTDLSGELTVAGSTTVLPINQECARLLMNANPDLRISVSGGGSGHGVKSVGAGEIDIGAASRDVKSSELEQYPDLISVAVGKDSVAIVVHRSNTINELTLEQAAQIFSGEITNWEDVGGANAAIRVLTREEGSGTRETFEKYVMTPFNKEVAGKASVKGSNGEVRATVSSDARSMGYLSPGYVDNTMNAITVGGIEATVANVLSGDYPIQRSLYLITKGEPSTLEQAFIDFVLSPEGQEVVEDMGYIKVVSEAAPRATPITTPPVAPTATTPTSTPEEPGFEAVCAITGLLTVSYLVLKRKQD
jgi:phosphate transport system substrate-binding protein